MMEETPEELDWVNKRADCELEAAFRKLSEAVEKDVGTFNSRFQPKVGLEAVFKPREEFDTFSVHRRRNSDVLWVTFRRKSKEIEIEDECGVQTLNAIPLLTENGRCKFQVGGEELEQWQLRRRALEAIFFRSTPR
jgi:hypothetical protein